MSIIFTSLNEEWVREITNLFNTVPNVLVSFGDILNLTNHSQPTLYVSPANSFGVMDGGIDMVLSRTLMPGVEQKARQRIKELSGLGRPYLRVGSVLHIPHDSSKSLLVCPTMFLPYDVSETQNAYYSAYAAFMMWSRLCREHNTQYRLLITSHCCGVGRMDPIESAQQMKKAYDDFMNNTGRLPVTHLPDGLLFPDYDTRENNEV
jgi:O-acetyl-ADP-ribose deacetylase (regulator of RNase III)